MTTVKTPVLLDSWVAMSWDEYLQYLSNPQLNNTKTYFYRGHGRFEILPVGFGHGKNHATVTYIIHLFCAINALSLCIVDTTTLRKTDVDDSQPDLSVWLGPKARKIPDETGIVDLDRYPTPDLVVEVAKTSLLDDMWVKRSLYEELNISEYWIINIQQGTVLAFEMKNNGSQRIETSRVLPDFDLATVEEALRLSKERDQAQMGAWLLKEFQQ